MSARSPFSAHVCPAAVKLNSFLTGVPSTCVPQASDMDGAMTVYSETNTVTVNSLIPGSIYAFQIRARNERGYGPYSNTIYFTTLPLGEALIQHITIDIRV